MSRGFGSLLGAVAAIFAVLFTAVAAGQYWFLNHQLREKTNDELLDSAEEMKEDIAFADTWSLQGYRRVTEAPDIYLVTTADGTLVDTHGYLPSMLFHVSVPFNFEYGHLFPFTSAVGENWSLYVRKLRDGLVILGVRAEITPPDVEERFVATSARFGNSVTEALKTPERAIDENFDFAIIDNDGTLRWAIGGIPLKMAAPEIPVGVTLPPISQINKGFFAGLIDPIVNKSGQKVGVIKVFEEVTGEQQVLHQSAIFNIVVTAILWSVTVALAAVYLRRTRVAEISCAQIPYLEESDTVEFKSSLRWDVVGQKANKELEAAVVKAVTGFLNSETGGTLVIGVDDKKQVLGLEPDYSTLETRPNRDGFELALRQTLINALGERCCARWIKVRFCSLQGKDLCKVSVSPATEPIFLKERGGDTMYVRVGNATRPLKTKEAVTYAGDRWGAPRLRRFHPTGSAPAG